MAMPTVVSVGAIAAATGSITPAPGGSRQINDIDILLVQTAGGASSLTTANGFVAITGLGQVSGAETTGCRMTVYWRRWNGSQGSPITNDSGDHQLGRMISIRGCVLTGDPWNTLSTGVTDTTADTSVVVTGGTTTRPNCLILAMAVQDDPDSTSTAQFGTATNASLGSITERMDNSTTSGTGGALWMVTGTLAAAGAYNNTTCTAVTSAAPRLCGTLALEGEGWSGSVAVSQEAQTPTASGDYFDLVTGTLAANQADQTATAAGSFYELVVGTVAAIQADQIATTEGDAEVPAFTGTVAAVQDDQTTKSWPSYGNAYGGGAEGTSEGQLITGTVAVTQADQTSTTAGIYLFPHTGTVDVVQADQTSTADGTITVPGITGDAAVVQDDQTATAAGTFYELVVGTVHAIAADQTATAAGVAFIAVTGTLAVTQEDQVSSSPGITPAIPITTPAHAQFQRYNGRLHLARLGRGLRRGFGTSEGWERVSEPFTLDENADDTVMELVVTAWADHAGSDAATLAAAINAALDAAGYRETDGSRLV